MSPDEAGDSRRDDAARADAQLARLARRAEAVIVFERLWPPLAWAAALAALFLAVSWFGLWQALPREARIGGVLLFAVALGVALAPLARLQPPCPRRNPRPPRPRFGRGASPRRLARRPDRRPERRSHRRGAVGAAPSAAGAAWSRRFRPAAPAPGMARRDPRALRFAALLAAICAALIAGPERYGRLASAFDWRSGASAEAVARLDAWIDPPAYADKPPILIALPAPSSAEQTIVAPEDSVLVVRAGAGGVETRIVGALAPLVDEKPVADSLAKPGAPTSGKPGMTAAANANAKPDAPLEKRWTIRGDGAFSVSRDGVSLGRFTIQAIPAGTPTITLTEPPRANLSGSLTLRYSLADRYGIAGAEAEFAKPFGREAPPRSLVPPPKLTLELPNALNGTGDATTTGDLSEHPWAGAQVVMTLKATGVSGHTGVTPATLIVLPQRQFRNPVARALVEQRRALILDPDHEPPRVAKAIAALTIAPDLFQTPAGVYLGLRDVEARLAAARGDADLLAVADLFGRWRCRIEDGDSTQAQRDLRAAEQKLREALQRGASDDELRKLTQELRDAAERYMRDLAQQNPPRDDNADTAVPQQDLEALLDKMDDLARNGARQDAEAMLDQLQNMFENMRGAPDAQEDAANRELRNQLDELSKLLRDQQALRDDTFRRDQSEQLGRNNPPDPNDAGKPSLQDRQQALNDRLAELQKRLKSLGMKGEKGLDDAQGDMAEAEGDLKGDGQGKSGDQGQGQAEGKPQGDGDDGALDGEGRTGKGRAVEAQGRALEALRQGAQGLQQQAQGSGEPGRRRLCGGRP